MRILKLVFWGIILHGLVSPLPGKDFAPCAPRSEAARAMAETAGWNSCQGIPAADRVGLPAPPGAEVSTLSGGGMDLPGIVLLSPAPIEDVVDFYKKALSSNLGWNWNNVLGIFYRGDAVSDALALKIPSVRIAPVPDPSTESFLVAKEFRDKVKTRIEIHYDRPREPDSKTPSKN